MLGASGYIPAMHWTEARANSEGLFAYYRDAEASMRPDLPHAGRHRIGMGWDQRG